MHIDGPGFNTGMPEAPEPGQQLIQHMCLEVDNLDSVIEQVKARGWEISEKTMGGDHSWQTWITDPNGIKIEFHEYTENSLQKTGKDCVVD